MYIITTHQCIVFLQIETGTEASTEPTGPPSEDTQVPVADNTEVDRMDSENKDNQDEMKNWDKFG